MASLYPFPFSDIKDQLPFQTDLLVEGSLITRAQCPLGKLHHETRDDHWELVDKERAV